MRAAEAAADDSVVDRYHLCFALGKALEDRQRIRRNHSCTTRAAMR